MMSCGGVLSQQDQHTCSSFADHFPQAEQEQKSKIVHIPVHKIACPSFRHVTQRQLQLNAKGGVPKETS